MAREVKNNKGIYNTQVKKEKPRRVCLLINEQGELVTMDMEESEDSTLFFTGIRFPMSLKSLNL